MSKKLQLTIPTPCHEDWDEMTTVEKGKFCGSCQKQVVDFSNMNDRQVAEFFKKPSTGSVCGRFMQDQLDRDIVIPKKRIPWVKYFFQFALPTFLVSIRVSAQTPQKIRQTAIHNQASKLVDKKVQCGIAPITLKIVGDVEEKIPSEKSMDSSQFISGHIIDEKGDDVVNSTIIIKGTNKPFKGDVNGRFNIQTGFNWENITLVIASVGFSPAEIKVNSTSYPGYTNIGTVIIKSIRKEEDIVVVTGGIGIKRRPKELLCMFGIKKDTVTKVPIEKMDATTKVPDKAIIKKVTSIKVNIYPNPVSSGSSITIDAISEKNNSLELRIISLDGHQVLSQIQKAYKGHNRFTVATSSVWPAGIYLIQLLDESKHPLAQEKIIIR